jgi:nitroreductase
MELSEAVKKRRSIRKFKQKPVEQTLIKKLINTARLSPSAANTQKLRYKIITTPSVVDAIFKLTAWAGYVKPRRNPEPGISAPTAFIALTAPEEGGETIHADAGAAVQSILLKAVELGLGACWIGAYNKPEADKILKIPGERKSIYLIALGEPAEEPVQENISKGESIKYYIDESDVLHVPKYSVEAITEWI